MKEPKVKMPSSHSQAFKILIKTGLDYL